MQARIDGQNSPLDAQEARLDRTLFEYCRRIEGAWSRLGDGEIVVEDASGISSFNDLQADLKASRQDRFRYFVFDVLYCEGFDLTKVLLKDRKDLLQQLLAILPPARPFALATISMWTGQPCWSMHADSDSKG
jgi:ATP dependent DNA ligase-like protein